MKISCPYCDSPVTMKGDGSWECGWCGNFGPFRELNAWDKAKLLQEEQVPKRISIPVRLVFNTRKKPRRKFSRAELEDMVRRWDLSENEWACRDLLIAAFPEEVARWSEKELLEADPEGLLQCVGLENPEAGIRMMRYLLDTAEEHLQEPGAARQIFEEIYPLCQDQEVQCQLLELLKEDQHLAMQLFLSACVEGLPWLLLDACDWFEETELKEKLYALLEVNPYYEASD